MLRNWAIHVQKLQVTLALTPTLTLTWIHVQKLQVPYAVRPRLRVRLRARV